MGWTALSLAGGITCISCDAAKGETSEATVMPVGTATAAPAPESDAATATPPAPDTDDAPSAFPAREVPAGPGPTGAFTVAYSIERHPQDENRTWMDAIGACRSHGQSLCTETQWLKACALDPALGANPSWTLTADYPGAAVRGGPEGCKARKFINISDKSPTRGGVCCSRAVAISTPVTTGTFREDMNHRILSYESALNRGEGKALAEMYGETVRFGKEELDRETLVERHVAELEGASDLLFVLDRCALKEITEGLSKLTQAQCSVVYHKGGRIRAHSSQIVWGSDGLLSFYGDPKDYAKPRETKERVSGFITSSP